MRQMAIVTLVVCIITPVFNLLTSEASLTSAIQGLFDGAFISFLVAGYLLFTAMADCVCGSESSGSGRIWP